MMNETAKSLSINIGLKKEIDHYSALIIFQLMANLVNNHFLKRQVLLNGSPITGLSIIGLEGASKREVVIEPN